MRVEFSAVVAGLDVDLGKVAGTSHLAVLHRPLDPSEERVAERKGGNARIVRRDEHVGLQKRTRSITLSLSRVDNT